MRLNRYINETLIIAGEDIEDTAKKIQAECKYAVKEMQIAEALLWRGTWRTADIVRKEKTRQDRLPLDTEVGLHNALDKAFREVYGWKARSQGLICSNDYGAASDYGQPRMIFPIGNYKALWMPGTPDVMDQIPYWLEDVDERPHVAIKEFMRRSNHTKKYGEIDIHADFDDQVKQIEKIREKMLIDKVKQFKQTSLKLPLMMEMPLEIMVRCKSYYSLSGRTPVVIEITKLLEIDYEI